MVISTDWRQAVKAAGPCCCKAASFQYQAASSSRILKPESHAQAVSATTPVHVISWDPSRPWRGPAQQPTRAAAALYSQGQL
ncbi:TPA: hypothetical protein ACH3X1_016607 [Trebouxia sp. C0004]